MGYYIETPERSNKAEQIARIHDGEIIPQPLNFSKVPEGKALICVVDNRIFEAAAFCYNEAEFKVFSDPNDVRGRKWVIIQRDVACELIWPNILPQGG